MTAAWLQGLASGFTHVAFIACVLTIPLLSRQAPGTCLRYFRGFLIVCAFLYGSTAIIDTYVQMQNMEILDWAQWSSWRRIYVRLAQCLTHVALLWMCWRTRVKAEG